MTKTNRKGTLHKCDHVWTKENSGCRDDWSTTIDDRFQVNTWKFGSIHQSKVFIKYENKNNGKVVESEIDMCFRPGKTLEEAMTRGLNWVKEFQEKGAPSVDQVFNDCWDHWPTLYQKDNRLPVICQMFFVIGNGYEWLDGCLINTSPDAWIKSRERDEADKERHAAIEKALAEAKEIRKKYLDPLEEEDTWESMNEKYWQQDVYSFYPVSVDYSRVCKVPDDVKPDWLQLAYEAALLLRDKSGVPDIKSKYHNPTADNYKRQEENRKIGAKVVIDLETRFPQLKKAD